MMRVIASLVFVLSLSMSAFGQAPAAADVVGVIVPREQEAAMNRLSLSKSRQNYPVTPGDAYKLSYRSAGAETSTEVFVESDYTLNLSVFGKVSAAGLTFPQLKARVETIIATAYPNSLPYLEIKAVGVFQVYVRGEVPRTMFATAWGMSRLSEVLLEHVGPSSSLRRVGVLNSGGTRYYDLFKGLYEGALEEDPFVKPGDEIVVYRRSREVEVKGEVFRPGKYQILEGESLADVIERYGRGLTPLADGSRVTVARVSAGRAEGLVVDLAGGATSVEMRDGDSVTVRSADDALPTVVFEGAVVAGVIGGGAVTTVTTTDVIEEPYNQITYRFRPGETLYEALIAVRDRLSSSANLAGAYIVRKGVAQEIPADLEGMLYRQVTEPVIRLAASDRIVIPPYRYYVSVVGAVNKPGSYRYVPNRSYSYYLGFAGGVSTGGRPQNIAVLGADGGTRSLDAARPA